MRTSGPMRLSILAVGHRHKTTSRLNRAIFAGVFLGPEPAQIHAELNEPFASISQPG